MKYLTQYAPPGSGDTSAFEAAALAIIGDENIIPDIPAPDSPAVTGSCKYYKCASVDTTAKTWSGYELILQDGVYEVSETLTEGLRYSAVTPVVGHVYSQDALITVRYANGLFPEDGLVFHASLNGNTPNTAETGQALTNIGNPIYDIVDGVPCAYFSDGSWISCSTSGFPDGSEPRSISIWLKPTQTSADWYVAFEYGTHSYYQQYLAGVTRGKYAVATYGNGVNSESSAVNKWRHLVIVFSGSNYEIYINGIKDATGFVETQTVLSDTCVIGADPTGSNPFNGYISACRFYNRALTQDEITALANEFTPTTV